MKIRPMEAELFHAHGQRGGPTDMTRLIFAPRKIANASKNCVSFTGTNWLMPFRAKIALRCDKDRKHTHTHTHPVWWADETHTFLIPKH
jgi:hypothetical protein